MTHLSTVTREQLNVSKLYFVLYFYRITVTFWGDNSLKCYCFNAFS